MNQAGRLARDEVEAVEAEEGHRVTEDGSIKARLTHVGGPTVLIELAGWRLLVDPTFDPPGRRYTFGWGTSSHKQTGPAVPASQLGPIDVVLLSHDHHADNLDDAGRALLPAAGVVLTTGSGARRLRATAGVDVRGLAAWGTTRLESPGKVPLDVVATPCRHGPPLSLPIVGNVVGFAVTPEGGTGALWVSGDTVLFDGVREVARRLDVDVALLHLGAVRFGLTGPLRYSMSGREAAELIDLLRPRVAVPVHFEGWSHFREQDDALHAAFEAAPADVRARIRWLTRGVPAEV